MSPDCAQDDNNGAILAVYCWAIKLPRIELSVFLYERWKTVGILNAYSTSIKAYITSSVRFLKLMHYICCVWVLCLHVWNYRYSSTAIIFGIQGPHRFGLYQCYFTNNQIHWKSVFDNRCHSEPQLLPHGALWPHRSGILAPGTPRHWVISPAAVGTESHFTPPPPGISPLPYWTNGQTSEKAWHLSCRPTELKQQWRKERKQRSGSCIQENQYKRAKKRGCVQDTHPYSQTHTHAHNTHSCIVTYTNTHACIFTYMNTHPYTY